MKNRTNELGKQQKDIADHYTTIRFFPLITAENFRLEQPRVML